METDIVVVGAGPVGLCLARSLAGSGLRVVVIDQQGIDSIRTPEFDGREIALTQQSVRIMQELDLWDRIDPSERSALRAAKVFNGASPGAMEIGHESGAQLGWLVPNHLIRQAAWDAVHDSATCGDAVTLLTSDAVTGVQTGATGASITTASGKTIAAQLIVAADSRFSVTRKLMGIPASLHDFGKSMLVCRMTHGEPHHHTAWEWFGHGQTLALLPLNPEPSTHTHAHRSSVVLTLPGHEMARLAQLAPDAFSRNLERRFAGRLGSMQLAGTRHVYPLVAVYPERFVAQRFATVGDAAVGMHPVTAHGFNLGLSSVVALSQEIIAAKTHGLDIADAAVLRRYEARHRRATKPLYLATRFITQIYTNDTPPARLARDLLLRAAARFTPFRRAVADSLSGHTPAFAHGGPATTHSRPHQQKTGGQRT